MNRDLLVLFPGEWAGELAPLHIEMPRPVQRDIPVKVARPDGEAALLVAELIVSCAAPTASRSRKFSRYEKPLDEFFSLG